MDIKKVLSERVYKAGYIVKKELIDFGGEELPMDSAYNPSGQYIGNPKDAYRLCKIRGIAPELRGPKHNVCSIGFCGKDKKWYGWSHRAMYGFKKGSTCKKGDCHYVPKTFKELRKDCHVREGKMCHLNAHYEVAPEDLATPMEPNDQVEATPATQKQTAKGIVRCALKHCGFELGKGEWTAQNTADAKQMAMDFAAGVS